MKTTFIYCLKDPRTGEPRYVGKANHPHCRFGAHLERASREKTHKGNWILSLREKSLLPLLEVLDEVPESQWQFWEREYIRVFRAIGFDLTNTTDGGDGAVGYVHSAESRRKLSQALTGRKTSPGTREKLRTANTGKICSEETKRKIGEANRGNHNLLGFRHSETSREKMRASHCRENLSAETLEKMSAANRRRVVSQETREKFRIRMRGNTQTLGYKHSPEAKEKIRQASLNRNGGRA